MKKEYTSFSEVYKIFLSKITDDMYMELTLEDTYKILEELLISALPKFEFPRQNLDYQRKEIQGFNEDGQPASELGFINKLTYEEINIIATYMIVEWIGQQLASIENVRMKYSGSDFKFTSQANHMQKLLQLKKDYEREGFHLQRLYKRRIKDNNGIYRSTFGKIMTNHVRHPRHNVILSFDTNTHNNDNQELVNKYNEIIDTINKNAKETKQYIDNIIISGGSDKDLTLTIDEQDDKQLNITHD